MSLNGAGIEPALLRWPAERAQRERLALAGRPRLLLISPTTPPPQLWDELEDWIRHPIDPAELTARAATVRARALRLARRPRFDDDGLLWSNDRWLSLSGAQFEIGRLVVERFGCVVPTAAVAEVLEAGGWQSEHVGQRVVLGRLRRQLATLDLALHQVRGRGPMLTLADTPPPAPVAEAKDTRALVHRASSASRGGGETDV